VVGTLTRLFNMREGFGRADDILPPRFSEDLPKHQGLPEELQEQIVTEYYREQGWHHETGTPLPETLKALEIEGDANAVAAPVNAR
jgi:aldehyde:ferredoxin oxidoreductase